MSANPPVWVALAGVPHALEQVEAGPWRTRALLAGDGEPVVLLHGTGGHLEAYAHNIGPLAERFRVIAPDFAGHGYTTHATQDLEIDEYVAQLVALLDALGVQSAHLTGESLGGWVAAKFAAKHPDRTRRLVLNTPGGTMARPEVMERIRALSQAAADDPTDARIRARLEWLMADPATVTDDLVAIRRAIYSRLGFAASMRHILCLQDPVVRQRNLITDDELEAVPNGAMVVWTSDDPSGPAAAGMDMAERIPDSKFRYIADAGHWPQWEQRDQFNTLVADYLGGATS